MNTSYRNHVVVAFLAAVTLLINPVSALAGTTTVTSPLPKGKTETTSAKKVEQVQPTKTAPAPAPPPPPAPAPAPKPEPAPTPAEIAAAPKADYAVTQTAFQQAIVSLTRLAEQGLERDKQQDARLDKLEQRVDEVPCLIQEAVDGFEIRLAKTEELVLKRTDALEVRVTKIEDEVIVLKKSEELRLGSSATATAVSTSTSTPPPAPQIIILPIQGLNQCVTPQTTKCYPTVPSCTTSRTTVLRQAPPVIHEKVIVRSPPPPPQKQYVSAPPTPYYDDGRPGILTRMWRGLFGSGSVAVCPPAMTRMPTMPTRNYCATPPSCTPPRQQPCPPPRPSCPPQPWCPPTFGWQQQPPVYRQPVMRSRCGPPPNYGGGGYRGNSGQTIINRNLSENNNLIRLRL